jgi:hypothetical protein
MSSTAKPKLAIGKVRKARITRRRLVHHWGQPHFVTPAYIPAFLGDGGMLLALQPLDTRPKFYLIRVDSSWSTSNFDETCVCDHLDEIYDAIEDWFGAEEWEDDHGRTASRSVAGLRIRQRPGMVGRDVPD